MNHRKTFSENFSDTRTLKKLIHFIENIRPLLEKEIFYRSSSENAQAQLCAVDFDIIYDFLNPDGGESEISLSALTSLEHEKFTILPGSLHEYGVYCSKFAPRIPFLNNIPDLLNFLKLELHPLNLPDLKTQKELRRLMILFIQQAELGIVALKNSLNVFKSDNFLDLADLDLNPSIFVAKDSYFYEAFKFLQTQRRERSRLLPNHNDSINLAILINACENSVFIPLLTKSSYVKLAYSYCIDKIDEQFKYQASDLVISPKIALFRMGLRQASQKQLQDLSGVLLQAQISLSSYVAEIGKESILPSTVIDLMNRTIDGIREIEDLVQQLDNVFVKLNSLWGRPASELPPEIDIDKLATIVLDSLHSLKKQLCYTMSSAQRFFLGAESFVKSISQRFTPAQRLLPVLNAVSSDSNISLYAEKLIYVAQGAEMTDKSIYQYAGRDLNATIESFKNNTLVNIDSQNDELLKNLSEFLEAVANSSISNEEKTSVLNEASNVANNVKIEGKLKGRAKILWYGVKEVINTIPKALDAWEKITAFWS